MAKSAMPSGVNFDMAMDRIIVVAKDGDVTKEKTYMDIAGLVSSYNEHDILEKIDEFSAVSVVKALQTASAGGISIQQVNSANIKTVLPALQVSSEIKTDIQNAVNAGKEVTIPQTNVQIDDWNGIGYIVKDPSSGAGSYVISGGLAGGDSTSNQDGMRIVEIYKDPLGKTKNDLDPHTRRTIVATAELASGEYVPRSRNKYTRGMSYTDIGQCVGLVRVAYWSAGICLDIWSPWATDDEDHPELAVGSCGRSNLVNKHHITEPNGTNGVRYFYDLANHLNILKSVRTTNDPLIGDIIFWDNTTDKNGNCLADDSLTHVGIVKTAPDQFGTLLYIHASSSGVRSDQLMNIAAEYKNNSNFNAYLRNNPPAPCTNTVDRLAGQLFSGFATIRDTECTDTSHK
jgi:hypothetical protein